MRLPSGVRAPLARLTCIALAACLALVGACDRGPQSKPARGAPVSPAADRRLPGYEFAEHVSAATPEVRDFLRRFLETCYAGDYAGYRQLVARSATPESPARFESMYRAIDAIRVESIDLVRVPDLPETVYRVVCDVRLNADARRAAREPERKLAILVFQEQGEWRMAPAPPALQPRTESPASAPDTQPSEPETHFPWDDEAGAATP